VAIATGTRLSIARPRIKLGLIQKTSAAGLNPITFQPSAVVGKSTAHAAPQEANQATMAIFGINLGKEQSILRIVKKFSAVTRKLMVCFL
jgi:hypothetical protein